MRKVLTIIFLVVVVALAAWFLIRGDEKTEQEVVTQPEQTQATEETKPNLFEHDQDRDGISDDREAELGTSDFEFDTDGDGVSDVDEIEVWKTDPTNVDSDGDGYADGWEIIKGFNPAGEGKL